MPGIRVDIQPVIITVLWLFATTLFAERAPRSPAQLLAEAELVVVGEIVELQVKTERSHIETGFGNDDWAIDLTLKVEKIEKGQFENNSIVARCFRIKSRKSAMEYMTPSGNHPIPSVETPVRAHLYQRDNRWRVVFPNGLTSLQPGVELADAKAVSQLAGGGYTFALPLEIWGAMGAIVVVPLILGWVIRRLWRRFRRRLTHVPQNR